MPAADGAALREQALTAGREFALALATQGRSALGALLPAGARCALVNFPNHDNPGDSAIWLGERAVLRSLGVPVVYECEWRTYSRRALEGLIDDRTVILLNGGGNFGDLYLPGQQSVRERVLEDFRGVPVVQLPQSMHFEREENLRRVARLIRAHGDVTLMLRERQSLERARAVFDAPAVLCPDAAFWMTLPPAPNISAQADVVWLAHSPLESRFGPPTPRDGMLVLDWTLGDTPRSAEVLAAASLNAELLGRMEGDDAARIGCWREFAQTFEPLARHRLACALRALVLGRIIITERLHGHILAVCCGLPHIVLDNSYGKTRSVHETWTAKAQIGRFARSPHEALRLADEWLSRAPSAAS